MASEPGVDPTRPAHSCLPELVGLSELSEAEAEHLAGSICRVAFAAGTEVVTAGPHSTTMIHVIAGTVEGRCGDRALTRAGPGRWLRADLSTAVGSSTATASDTVDDEPEIDIDIVVVAVTDVVVDLFDLRDLPIVLDTDQRTGTCRT